MTEIIAVKDNLDNVQSTVQAVAEMLEACSATDISVDGMLMLAATLKQQVETLKICQEML